MSGVDERYQAKIAGRRNGTVPVFQQAPVVSETATDPASVDARFRAKMAARAVAVSAQPEPKKPEQKGDAGAPDKAEKAESKDKPEDDKPKKPEQKGDAGGRR